MNKISDTIIKDYVNNQYNYLIKQYDERQIFGIFTFGKVNHGFARVIEDIETAFVYVPTFEEMCTNPAHLSDKYIYDNNNNIIKKIDARLLYTKAIQQDKNIMEGLFSDYSIINPRYEKVFKKHIYMNREAIFHCNQELRIQNAVQRALASLEHYQETKQKEDLFESCRLRIACQLYIEGASCENCINLKKDYHIGYLWQILEGNIVPDLNEIKQDLLKCLEEAKDFQENIACKEIIRRGCVEVIKTAVTDLMQEEDFLTVLTETEKQALNYILDNLEDGYEGHVSIVQLTNESGISRPVFKNLLQKMQDKLIAEVENRGVKGTYIKIIDGNILQLR